MYIEKSLLPTSSWPNDIGFFAYNVYFDENSISNPEPTQGESTSICRTCSDLCTVLTHAYRISLKKKSLFYFFLSHNFLKCLLRY